MKTTLPPLMLLSAALFAVGCTPASKECSVNTDCAVGQICSSNKCVAVNMGGGTGGGDTGGGTGGGTTGGGTGGGTTGGGTGGGTTGGGTGGGTTGGGTGGGTTDGGTGGGTTGGGGGATGGGGGASVCGDGAVEGTEACDDGATAPADGCSATCTLEAGFSCTGAPSVCVTLCGDGIVTAPETCDDSALTPNDGCSATCTTEPGYTCTGAPSVCSPTPIQGGEACASAVTIGAVAAIASTTVGLTNDYAFSDTGNCAGGSSSSVTAPDAVFRTTIPANSRLTVTATSTWDMVLNLVSEPVSNCGAALGAGIVCLAGADGVSNGTETVTALNTGATPLDVFILVDGYSNTASGAFSLTTDTQPLPAGDRCDSAVAISGTQLLTAQTMVGFGNDYTAGAGCVSSSSGADRVYSVSVPAGNRLTASVTPDIVSGTTPTFNPVINVVSTATCSTTLTCVQGANGTEAAGTDTVIFDNATGAAQTVFVVIDTSTTTLGGTGTFSLDVNLAPVTFLAGEVCTNSSPVITASGLLSAQSFTGYASNYASNGQNVCRYGPGADRSYAIDVASGDVLTVRAVPVAGGMADGGTVDVALSLVDSTVECGSGPCLSGADSTGSTTEVVTQSNLGGTGTRRFLVVVDSKASGVGPFDLDVTMAPAPAGDSCGNTAAALATSTTLATESLVSYGNDFTGSTIQTGCAFASGQDRVYAVTIPANGQMTVAAASSGDLALNVVPGPAAACTASPVVCTARADVGSSGTETVTHANATGAAQTVFVIVDRFGTATGTETFSFALSISVCGNGVVESGEACDDGNMVATDGCSSTCAVQAGYTCTGSPSVCTSSETLCSDGTDNDGDTLTDCSDPDCAAGCGTFPACGTGQALHVFNVSVPLNIPDSNSTGVSSVIPVGALGTIARLGMRVNITHTFDGDLDLSLISPANVTLDVSSDNGGSGANYVNTVLDTTCTTAVTAGSAPFTGCYRPETSFASLTGLTTAGNWTFKAADDAGGDEGTINNWSLMMCVTP